MYLLEISRLNELHTENMYDKSLMKLDIVKNYEIKTSEIHDAE